MMKNAIIQTKVSQVKPFITEQFGKNLHAKQIESLANGVLGVLEASSLKPSKIGEGLAAIKGILPKHGIKQVDRYLSNSFFNPYHLQCQLARFIISNRKRIYVAMDWTVFAKDNQMTLTLRLVTKHGRATPLLWETVSTVGLKNNKTDYAFKLLERLRHIVVTDCEVIVLADREFGIIENMCLAAWRGEIKASRNYRPMVDLPFRCEGYQPKPDDPDQRQAYERWPKLFNKNDPRSLLW